jgi:hypothetical protein
MLTENEARDLLTAAARTIHVEAAEPIMVLAKRPPRWPVLAAAAAILAVVATSVALAQRTGDPQPVGPVVDIPRADFQPYSSELAANQIPSVFGYDADSARSTLQGLGLNVKVATEAVPCTEPGGRALRTEPEVGTRFSPGAVVNLFVGKTPTAPCPANGDLWIAWQLLDFANGRGPAPDFADRVLVSANAETSAITGSEAADPLNWVDGTPLGVLRQESRAVQNFGGGVFQTPFLRITPTHPRFPCRPAGAGMPTQGGLSIVIEFNTDRLSFACPAVDVFRTNGQITAIALRTLSAEPGPEADVVPDLRGLPIGDAQATLRELGLQAEYVQKGPPPPVGCAREEVIATQDPLAGTLASSGFKVLLTMRWAGCADGSADSLDGTPWQQGMAFLEFAYGGKTFPHFADQVGLYLGNQLKKTLTPAEARQLWRWQVTGPYADATGPFSAIEMVTSGGVENPAIIPGAAPAGACVHSFPDQRAVPGSVAVTLTNDGQAGTCMDAYFVLLYVDDAGQLISVNLLLGSP